MVKKRITLPDISGLTPSILRDRKKQTDISIQQFLELHDSFFKQKSLEGLASRTLRDHEIHMLYFKKYLISDNRSKLDRCVDVDLFRGYLAYMTDEKELKRCTINIRLRTLKCYLKWLFDEEHIDFNYSIKLKLLRVPEDTIKPLSDADVKKCLTPLIKASIQGLEILR